MSATSERSSGLDTCRGDSFLIVRILGSSGFRSEHPTVVTSFEKTYEQEILPVTLDCDRIGFGSEDGRHHGEYFDFDIPNSPRCSLDLFVRWRDS